MCLNQTKLAGLFTVALLLGWIASGMSSAGPTTVPATQPELTADQSTMLTEARNLGAQVISLYGKGKFSEAVPPALRAVDLFRGSVGEEHVDYATSLNNLALLYY